MFARQTFTIAESHALPFWRRPVFLLCLMAAALPISFAVWSALLNNFVIEAAGFTGVEIGWLHSVREIPGFLAIGVIFLIFFIREQVLAYISLILLGVATALTAAFPSFGGLLFVTLISSIGFHYFETVNQSLQLQWIPRDRAPQMLGWIASVGAGASLLAYGVLVVAWKTFDLSYGVVYGIAGCTTLVLAVFAWLAYPQFQGPTRQNTHMVLRRRYWLYYLLQFMSGARRQIFVVFAAFMMVERFGFQVHELTALFLINYLANMFCAPMMGRALARFGERNVLVFEYRPDGGLYRIWWHIRVWLGLYRGRDTLCAGSSVLWSGLWPAHLFPKNCRSSRYCANSRSGFYHQPHCSGFLAGTFGLSLGHSTFGGVFAGGWYGADIVVVGPDDPTPPRGRIRNHFDPSSPGPSRRVNRL